MLIQYYIASIPVYCIVCIVSYIYCLQSHLIVQADTLHYPHNLPTMEQKCSASWHVHYILQNNPTMHFYMPKLKLFETIGQR